MPNINDQILRLRGGGNRGSTHSKGRNRKTLQVDRLEKLFEIIDMEMDIVEELCERQPNTRILDMKESPSVKEFKEPEKVQDEEQSFVEEEEEIYETALECTDTEEDIAADSKNLISLSFLSKERSSLEELKRNWKLYIIM